MTNRAILVILDGVGIGEAADSASYGDAGSNSLVHTADAVGGLVLPHMGNLGLGNLGCIAGVAPTDETLGAYGVLEPASNGKDSTTGHWELMGVLTDHPFPTYPNGFPPEIIKEFENRIGRKTLGNVVASGTDIIQQLGTEHIQTACPIVYTSADSVFQIAAHEDVIPLDQLYNICEEARRMLAGDHNVGRVIARPFVGKEGDFERTSHRHDYSVMPPKTVLDYIAEAGGEVIGIGKIKDLFAGRGISESIPTTSNTEGIRILLEKIGEQAGSLIFINLLDFDQMYGHRNDARGYAAALQAFDEALPSLMQAMHEGDLLFITADHGNDPTTPSTDHSRECVPVLVYGPGFAGSVNLGRRQCFSDVGQTIAEHLGITMPDLAGKSFYQQLRKNQ